MTYRSDIVTDLIQYIGSDEMIARAARVSTGADLIEGKKIEGLIRYLVRESHTSPLEHSQVTFRIEAPIFVAREAMRHRTFSFNERSARYSEIPLEFYVPADERPLVNAGSGAKPDLVAGSHTQYLGTVTDHDIAYEASVDTYKRMLDQGIATEVARDVLPVGTYTAWYQTGNLHAWMNFLTLRLAPNAQYEIRVMAQQIQEHLDALFPIAMAAYREFRS